MYVLCTFTIGGHHRLTRPTGAIPASSQSGIKRYARTPTTPRRLSGLISTTRLSFWPITRPQNLLRLQRVPISIAKASGMHFCACRPFLESGDDDQKESCMPAIWDGSMEHDDFHHSFDKVILRMYSHKPTTHIAHGQRCSARRCAREGKATMHIAYILAMYYPDHHRDQRRCPCAPLSSKGFQVLNAQRPNPFPEHDSGESGGSSGAQRKDRSGPSATIQAPTYSVL